MLHTPHIIPFHQFFARSFFFVSVVVSCCYFFSVICSLYHYYYIYVFLSIFFQFTHSYGVVCMPVVFSVAVRIQNNRKSTNSESWAISFTCCRVDNPNGKRRRRKKNETINKTGKQCQPTYYLDSGSFLLQRSWVFRLVYLFCCCCCCCLLTFDSIANSVRPLFAHIALFRIKTFSI